jgi:hypothetical protein
MPADIDGAVMHAARPSAAACKKSLRGASEMRTGWSEPALPAAPETTSSNQNRSAAADGPDEAASSRISRIELESFGAARRLPLARRSLMAAKVAMLEERLFDREGQQQPGLSGEGAIRLLGQINDLRHDLGWLRLDLGHHHIWPADIAS